MKLKDGFKIKEINQIIDNKLKVLNNKKFSSIHYEYDYRGEYALGWVVFIKNNIEIQRISDKNICKIIWE